ncbi:lipid II flippase Amj family protein [Bacillus siamensis]|uniref:lipid II flippase Amj family protein n=1 Tax=Bacillus siamensis TaxID=659243 RepID=UPI002900EE9C|nr:lipid II flippase Amj family protein [Bacillus siamensis]MDU0813816.1 lipid II flippase Amj family protein [Bacillus siamensis]MED5048566.1 lipid II flippase Amj family protein [Bacillus siamensis]MED5096152.1 lipid II flippase Amj family protein [Bacillus siamensis]
MHVITSQVLFIFCFLLLIHSVETLAYATRLSGARVGFIASALSLFNVMVIVSRMSNMVQQPFTGHLIDAAGSNALSIVGAQFRFLIFGSTVGTILGICLLPTFVALFTRAIIHLADGGGSVMQVFKKGFSLNGLKHARSYIRLPSVSYLKGLQFRMIPKRLFVINMVITSIYTIGVLSALYAGLLAPEHSTTAVMASGLINGIATMLLAVFVDPKVSVLADDVAKGKRSYVSLKWTSLTMVTSRVAGTLLAQLVFLPGAYYIAWVTKWM